MVGLGAHDGACAIDCGKEFATAIGLGVNLLTYEAHGWGSYLLRSECYRDSLSQFLLDPSAWTSPPGGSCQ